VTNPMMDIQTSKQPTVRRSQIAMHACWHCWRRSPRQDVLPAHRPSRTRRYRRSMRVAPLLIDSKGVLRSWEPARLAAHPGGARGPHVDPPIPSRESVEHRAARSRAGTGG
jgi:hypothetical protein